MATENGGFNVIKFLNITEISFITKTVLREYEWKAAFENTAVGCHRFWSIYYVEEGEISVAYHDAILTLQQGEILYIEPYAPHYVFSGKNDLSYKFDFAANSSVLDDLAGKVLPLPSNLKDYVSNVYFEALDALLGTNKYYPHNISFEESVEKTTSKPYWQQLICMHIEYITLYTARNNIADNETFNKKRGRNDIIVDVIKFLENNIYGKLTLQDICNEFAYSKSSLIKKFTQTFHSGIMEKYTYLKINEAMRLIGENRLNLTEIADLLCFSNERNFSRTFKRISGFLPSDYRERLSNSDENKRAEPYEN